MFGIYTRNACLSHTFLSSAYLFHLHYLWLYWKKNSRNKNALLIPCLLCSQTYLLLQESGKYMENSSTSLRCACFKALQDSQAQWCNKQKAHLGEELLTIEPHDCSSCRRAKRRAKYRANQNKYKSRQEGRPPIRLKITQDGYVVPCVVEKNAFEDVMFSLSPRYLNYYCVHIKGQPSQNLKDLR